VNVQIKDHVPCTSIDVSIGYKLIGVRLRKYSSLLIQWRPISICIFRHSFRNREFLAEVVLKKEETVKRSATLQPSMKTLVVFYSRTGITRKVAETIARILSGDVEEIFAREDRSDFSGFDLSREEAVLKKPAAIKATKRDPARYDLTIVGTPI
jgi:hypothetical protein